MSHGFELAIEYYYTLDFYILSFCLLARSSLATFFLCFTSPFTLVFVFVLSVCLLLLLLIYVNFIHLTSEPTNRQNKPPKLLVKLKSESKSVFYFLSDSTIYALIY